VAGTPSSPHPTESFQDRVTFNQPVLKIVNNEDKSFLNSVRQTGPWLTKMKDE